MTRTTQTNAPSALSSVAATVRYATLLARADEDLLSQIIGRDSVRLLALLDPGLAAPSSLRALTESFRRPEDVLRDPALRTALLEGLSRDEAIELASRLGLDASDPYGSLGRIQFSRRSKREEDLFTALDVFPEDLSPPKSLEPIEEVGAQRSLFAHQRNAIRSCIEVLNGPSPRRVLLHMPTGSGKTRSAMHVVARYLQRQEPAVVLWLTYSEELCEQAAGEFVSSWRDLGDRQVQVYRYWGGNDLDIADVRDGLFVGSLAKLYERAKRDADFVLRLADRSCLVVFDEAHQAVADTYRFVLELVLQRDLSKPLLGLSATPGRSWNDVGADEELAGFFGRNKVILAVEGFTNPVDYLISAGYLADPVFRSLTYAGGHELSPVDLERISTGLDVPNRILDQLAHDEQRNLLIVDEVERLAQTHERIIVFAASVQHAELLSAVLGARGHDAQCVTGGTPTEQRQRVLARFRSDRAGTMILTNFGVLTTGFDAPRTSAAVIARPTQSLVLYSQMIGRALRGPRVGGNASAEIVTIVDTRLPGFGNQGEAFMNWEDVW